ncbi:MAG TPA: hypothetical protein VGB63_02900, partial [Pedobacter sp.]
FLEDTLRSTFSRASVNYGLHKRITVGGGMEYLASLDAPLMPFINTSVSLHRSLLLASEYTYNVSSRSILTYRRPSDLQLELTYIRYKEGQRAINLNYLEERRLSLSMPLKNKDLSMFSRFSIYQIVMPDHSNATLANLVFSGVFLGVNTNFTTFSNFSSLTPARNIASGLSQTYRFGRNTMFTPLIQYNYSQQRVALIRGELEKRFFSRSVLNLVYEHNFQAQTRNISLGFRFDLPFARTNLIVRNTNNLSYITQYANGGIIYDNKSNYLRLRNQNSLGRGGLVVLAFLDLNANGKKDSGEPKIEGLRIKIKNGRQETNVKDTTLQIFDLEPYVSNIIEVEPSGFQNISWQVKKPILNVPVNPNNIKTVEIPVSVVGEVSGILYVNRNNVQKGQGQITIQIVQDGRLVKKIITESDGYFSYTGLPPGQYNLLLDPDQLDKLNLKAISTSIPFDILPSIEGDVVDGLQFVLTPTG